MFVRALAWGVGGGAILAALEAAYDANSASFAGGLLLASLLTFALFGPALFLVLICCALVQHLLWPEVSQPSPGDGTRPPSGPPTPRAPRSHTIRSAPSS